MTKAKQLIWEDGPAGWRGICGTHVYRINDRDIGPIRLTDNQNGWDCFSQLCETVEEAKTVAQSHFDNLIAEMAA